MNIDSDHYITFENYMTVFSVRFCDAVFYCNFSMWIAEPLTVTLAPLTPVTVMCFF